MNYNFDFFLWCLSCIGAGIKPGSKVEMQGVSGLVSDTFMWSTIEDNSGNEFFLPSFFVNFNGKVKSGGRLHGHLLFSGPTGYNNELKVL